MRTARASIVATAVLAAGVAASAAAHAQSTLRLVPQADLRVLDSVFTTVTITGNYMRMVYDTLFSMDSKLSPKPQMVESYRSSDDKLTWTFTLRPGLKFHDGTPVTSKDVVASFDRWQVRAVDLSYLDAPTPEARKAVVDRLQQKFFEVVPFVPVGQFTRPIAFRKSLKGVIPHSWDLALWNIEKVGN